MADLRSAAEDRVCTSISDEEYQLALPLAQRKLEHINSRYGHHGDAYLAVLIAEAVQAQRLTRYLETVNACREANW